MQDLDYHSNESVKEVRDRRISENVTGPDPAVRERRPRQPTQMIGMNCPPEEKPPNPVTSSKSPKMMQLDEARSRCFHPQVVKRVSGIVLLILVCYILSWTITLDALSHELSLSTTITTMVGCMLNDLACLFINRHQLWYGEVPEAFTFAMITYRMASYSAWTILMSRCGPFYAAVVVWLVPLVERGTRRLLRRYGYRQGGKIRYVQGPFPRGTINKVGVVRLASFNVGLMNTYTSSDRNRTIEILGYALTYIAFFSQDSDFSKLLALAVAMFVRSDLLPQPQVVKQGRMVDHLIRRERQFAMDLSFTRHPSLKECCNQLWINYQRMMQSACEEIQDCDYLGWFADISSWTNKRITSFNTALTLLLSLSKG